MMARTMTFLFLAMLALPIAVVLAHPMGNFSISHYAAIRVERDELRLRYHLDMAEIPTFQEQSFLDVNKDRTISATEREAYLSRMVEQLTNGQSLTVNGMRHSLSVVSTDLRIRPGAGDLPTLLLTIDYRASLVPSSERQVIEYADNNFSERAGWREIIAVGSDEWSLVESNVPSSDRSGELTLYPADATIAPPQVSRARLIFRLRNNFENPPSAIGNSQGENPQSAIRNPQSGDRLTELITAEELSLGVLLFSLLVAFGLGSIHAMSPGHGKTVVAAYLVGSRGTIKHAFLLGAVVTFTHTAGVFALGFVALFASKYILPEQLYPWLGFASGMTIVGIGLWQFVKRYKGLVAGRGSRVAGNMSDRAGNHPHHDHQTHDHHHHGHPHVHDANGAMENPARDPRPATHDQHGHSHQIDKITPRSLIALGVSGGLVPCPSALVVLLSAVTLNRIGFGLLLIVAFSLGLASVLIAIGVLMLHARRFVERFRWQGGLLRRLPVVSSVVITLLGLIIALQALVSGGVIQFDSSILSLRELGASLMAGLAGIGSETTLISALGLGFILGLKHALDPDHIVAVSAIVSEHRSLARSSSVGTFWGIGHTITLLLVGMLVIGFRLTIPDRVALSLEFIVALMLIGLGLDVIRKAIRFDLHSHPHTHQEDPPAPHRHLHAHVAGLSHHEAPHRRRIAKRPLFVGMVHGLAGSAALMLLVLATIPSPWIGLAYIALFGVGSIGGMLIMSSVIGLPFVWTARRFQHLNRRIRLLAGLSSVAFGMFLVWEIGFVDGLLVY